MVGTPGSIGMLGSFVESKQTPKSKTAGFTLGTLERCPAKNWVRAVKMECSKTVYKGVLIIVLIRPCLADGFLIGIGFPFNFIELTCIKYSPFERRYDKKKGHSMIDSCSQRL